MPRRSIMVVDENVSVRSTLAAILTQAGYRVVHTACLHDATERLKARQFNLVVMEIKLPDSDGLTTLAALHAIFPRLPVVVISTYSAQKLLDEASSYGVHGYFLKPVDPVQLLGCITNILTYSRTKPGEQPSMFRLE